MAVDFSCNELATLVKHAAQGAGHPMPEALSYAAVWMSRYDFSALDFCGAEGCGIELCGARLACQVLDKQVDGQLNWQGRPEMIWQLPSTPYPTYFCPVLVGCYLADNALADNARTTIGNKTSATICGIANSGLMLPYWAALAKTMQISLAVDFYVGVSRVSMIASGEALWLTNVATNGAANKAAKSIIDTPPLGERGLSVQAQAVAGQVSIQLINQDAVAVDCRSHVPSKSRVRLSQDILARLKTHAASIYAPATEESRQRGAG
ncbi:hypothetical protein [Ostreibacterium oceani]|uniref:DUF3726 domain-containing protein n=1 Tax=Ostreibacterium oceani TaxID=2654998 RepID=A0A6N7F0H7_9GAMM|nr:hypothetical protein [Ostreibacterium oceani]MPV86288.1 hypothetical protein [Ostreibacterium oceani]